MRDQHRPKQDLINEVIALRKQVADLKEAITARRRVEDALRESEALLRAFADGAPLGLCLFDRRGAPVIANRTFARLLGYDSPAELHRVAGVLGVFADRDEESRVLRLLAGVKDRVVSARFRLKNGLRETFYLIGVARGPEGDTVIAVTEHAPEPAGAASSLEATPELPAP